jgi:hypothetical protein
MIELKAVESGQAREESVDPRTKYYLLREEGVSLKPGDEFLVMVGESKDPARERYGFAVRISERTEPEEDEMLIQYGDDVFVAQKLPEFI